MSRAALASTGSLADRITNVAAQLSGLEDLHRVEYLWPKPGRQLEDIAERARMVRARNGSTVAMDAPLRWLEDVMAESPALAGPDAEPLRSELAVLIGRIRG